MRNLLYLFIYMIMLVACNDNNSKKFSKEKEIELHEVITFLDSINFRGTINMRHQEVRNLKGEVVENDFSFDTVKKHSGGYDFSSIVREDNFIYFVIDGFSGTSFGLVYTKNKNIIIKDFYNADTLSSSSLGLYKWYFASTKKY